MTWGYKLNANWDVAAGLMPWFSASAGSIELNYPATFSLQYPKTVAPGQWATIVPSLSASSGAQFSVTTPNLDCGVNALLGDQNLQKQATLGLADTVDMASDFL